MFWAQDGERVTQLPEEIHESEPNHTGKKKPLLLHCTDKQINERQHISKHLVLTVCKVIILTQSYVADNKVTNVERHHKD